jgi:putative oxidoreductase
MHMQHDLCWLRLQRLFWTFADGWPGVGLFLQRLLTGTVLLYQGIICLSGTTACPLIVPQAVGAVAGAFLLVGLLTPVAGMLVAIAGGWMLCSRPSDPVAPVSLVVLGATLAMIGPGSWSIDARLFGRRHIKASEL